MSVTDRLPLSRERVAEGALAFIDEHGLAGLSMRKLGAELGVEAMSLYNHVDNKDDLLDAVVELLHHRVVERYTPAPDSTWADDARMMANAYRNVALAHPKAYELLQTRPVGSEIGVIFLARIFHIFTKAGLEVRDAAIAFDTATSFVTGALNQELGLMRALEAQGGVDADSVPAEFADVIEFTNACLTWTPDERFERGLELLIAGLETSIRPRS